MAAESRPTTTAREGAATITSLELKGSISVRDLAEEIDRSPIEIIKVLMGYGIMASINQTLDFDTAAIVGEELGIEVKPYQPPVVEALEAEEEAAPKTLRQQLLDDEAPEDLKSRPPIVTVLGHVDHGKTTLLDAIRSTDVVAGESGGITQHIGAYQVEIHDRKITFLDTPGHEAFTAMRARGAQTTDIAVLVVAADDGVMPQTREAIGHARAAQVPIIVALNKIDRPEAQPERVKQELADLGLVPEDWGGETIVVPISAKQRKGIEELLENILLVADVAGFKANPDRPAVGTVIEAKLDRQMGPAATLLVLNGTLKLGDSLSMGESYGRVRTMFDDRGNPVKEAPPAIPVLVVGLDSVPTAGDTFVVMASGRAAREVAEQRARDRDAGVAGEVKQPITLADLHEQISAGKVKELNLVLKADVQGSLEPITSQLTQLGTDDVKVRVLYEGIGNVNESDVTLAATSNAIVIGFQVSVDGASRQTAEMYGVDVRLYDVIYQLIDDIDKALRGLMDPVYKDVVIGHVEVRQIFRVRGGVVAGCYVTDGIVRRDAIARLRRDGEMVHEGRITSLRRFKDDVAEVRVNYECGITLEGFNDVQEGDIIEAYRKERVS